VSGLGFECQQCGACCSGPRPGYIWVTKPQIGLIADFLKEPIEQVRRKYIRRVGFRTTIIEQPYSKDCIFLRRINNRPECIIYPVRPNQCRTWPFWPENLKSPAAWNEANKKCPGINQGRRYEFEQIEKIRKQKKWW
jgi:Fe-S-cluster containining protein